MNDTIILSISILISGRKEMRKCLDSLKPFLKKIPCELILVDTGCGEEQLAIAREYTDIIVPFAWCDDFSAARNAGLERARGEWFLYLDDDEWFEDPSEIVDFFVTGEYRKYGCARYYQRNYTERRKVNSVYVDNVVSRMIRLTPEVRFCGIIHEYLTPTTLPIKDFNTYVEHYGYIFENTKEKYKHVERNTSLLWKQIKQEPDSLRWYIHLIQEYMGISEYEKVIELGRESSDVYNRSKSSADNTRTIGAVYGYIVSACMQKYDYPEALKWCHKGIEDKRIYDCAKAYLHFLETVIYQKEEQYQEGLTSFLSYMRIYRKKGKDKYILANETSLINNSVFQETTWIGTVLRGLVAAANLRNRKILEEYFYELDWSDKRLFGQEYLEKALLEFACEELGKQKEQRGKRDLEDSLLRMIRTLGERQYGILELAPVMAELEQTYQQENQEEAAKRIWEIGAQIDSDHPYILSCKILVADQQGSIDELEVLYGKAFTHCEAIYRMKAEVWDIAERRGIRLEPFLLQADFNQWKSGTEEWVSSAEAEVLSKWQRRIKSWQREGQGGNDIRYRFFFLRCGEALLYRETEGQTSLESRERLIWEHAACVLSYYRDFYQEYVFTDLPEALPLEAQLALRLKKVREYREQGEESQAIACLRSCISLYPVLEKVMADYAKDYKERLEEQNRKAEEERTELVQLVRSLKHIALKKIEEGSHREAREILVQIQRCVPDDGETLELLRQLDAR